MKLFVTGTDTNIGKTVATCALLHALRSRGVRAIGMKPVAAGADPQGVWDDVERIRAASPLDAPLEDIAPYRLRAPASPHLAAREDGVAIRREAILAALARLERFAEMVVIEGVGGFRVPLSDEWDSADLAQAIGAPILLVVPMRLGCINHALLTAEAIAHRGLALAGWIANSGIDPDYDRVAQTIDTLDRRIGEPCVGVLPRLALGQSGTEQINIDAILLRLPSIHTPLRRCS